MGLLSRYFSDELSDAHQALVDAICLSILADGEVSREGEEVAVNVVTELTEMDSDDASGLVRNSFKRIKADPDDVLHTVADKLTTQEEIVGVFFAAAWVQYLDGEISTEEDSFLYTLADVLGLDEEEVEDILAEVEENIDELDDDE